MSETKRCPKCGSADLRALVNSYYDWGCIDCGKRFNWIVPSPEQPSVARSIYYPSRLPISPTRGLTPDEPTP